MAALAEEVARSTPELKAAFQQGLENIPSAIKHPAPEYVRWS
jgi:hypothetical protein